MLQKKKEKERKKLNGKKMIEGLAGWLEFDQLIMLHLTLGELQQKPAR